LIVDVFLFFIRQPEVERLCQFIEKAHEGRIRFRWT
jgi:hypothetical protein